MHDLLRVVLAIGAALVLGTAAPAAAVVPHGHGESPMPAVHQHGTTTGHDHGSTTVGSPGPSSGTRLLVLSLFAAANGAVLMVASVWQTRTADERARRRTARSAAPPAV